MAKKRKAKAVSNMKMFAYCKRVLGYKQVNGVSLFEVVTAALEKEGHKKPAEVGFRQFVNSMSHIINGERVERKQVSSYGNRVSVKSSDFLSSYEWRRVRMLAIKKYGNRCQCCGASPSDGIVINVDHIKPRRLYPELALDVDNLQILCNVCNHGKGNWDMTDWRDSDDVFLDVLASRNEK